MLNFAVVPLVGTWIEIFQEGETNGVEIVVPLVGTWIEITKAISLFNNSSVVPLVGTWIEIGILILSYRVQCSRSPRGNVD